MNRFENIGVLYGKIAQKKSIQHSEHGESLKSRIVINLLSLALFTVCLVGM
jgi:hypothetical protein